MHHCVIALALLLNGCVAPRIHETPEGVVYVRCLLSNCRGVVKHYATSGQLVIVSCVMSKCDVPSP